MQVTIFGHTFRVWRPHHYFSTYVALFLLAVEGFSAYPGITTFLIHFGIGLPLLLLVLGLAHWEGRKSERRKART